MGTSATKAKRKWNSAHYINVTVAMNPELAAGLKADCREKGVSVSSVIIELITQYMNADVVPAEQRVRKEPADNRARRKKELLKHIAAIEKLCGGEETYLSAIPENLRSSVRYENAENSVEHLQCAIDELREVYP